MRRPAQIPAQLVEPPASAPRRPAAAAPRRRLVAGGLPLALAALLGAAACGRAPEQEQAATVRAVAVPMRDGVELATDLYLPETGASRYPVVLIRTPYNKAWMQSYGDYYARAGLAVAIQDVRGRWASPGDWEPFVHEGDDGYDAIEWLARQPWCTGRVGMVGGSYAGTAQFLAAVRQPPHLVTIVPTVAPAVPYQNIPREGGALALGWALRWADLVENAQTGGQLQERLRAGLQRDWTPLLAGLPVADLDRAVVGRRVAYFQRWLEHGPGDPYWDAVDYLEALGQVDIPVFLQGGWFDPGMRGAPLAFERLTEGGNRHVRFLVGPWAHGDRGSRMLNGIDMGAEAQRDLMLEYRKWLEFFLLTDGSDAVDEPGVELYVMGLNRWVGGPAYPPPGTGQRALYLAGDGALSWEAPRAAEAIDAFDYDPAAPTPSFHAALKRGDLAAYRRRVEQGGDVLVYESAPFAAPVDLVGPVAARLFAASSARDTDWTATLYGLTPTGEVRVLGLTFGILRARHREAPAPPSLLEPGRVYEYAIDMGHTGARVAAGERLRLEIASAAFPEFSRNLNTGEDNHRGTRWVTARQQIHRDADHPSRLLLTVREDR